MLNLDEGSKLVRLARKSVEAAVLNHPVEVPEEIKKAYSDFGGCFVTLFLPHRQLRGCIGFPQPILPLFEALVRAAQDVTDRDPRFPPVSAQELSEITVEINVLTEPILMQVEIPEDYIEQIRIGKDGLYLRTDFTSGLLLPQVASDRDWDAETFLKHTCYKAGLRSNAWRDLINVRIYKFQSQIFEETEPNGEVIELH
jgi:uncharacterized protein (TIGR00296 family)